MIHERYNGSRYISTIWRCVLDKNSNELQYKLCSRKRKLAKCQMFLDDQTEIKLRVARLNDNYPPFGPGCE